MDKKTIRYILLYVGIALGVMVISYIGVSLYLGVPFVPTQVSQLLPQSVREIVAPSPIQPAGQKTGQPGTPPTSVKKLPFINGATVYILKGRFIAKPSYQGDLLRGEFVIDEDPFAARVPVIMTARDGNINVGRFQGSLTGSSTWKLEPTETLRELIEPNAPAQLRIQYFPDNPNSNPNERRALENILKGNWENEEFVFLPAMVGIVE